MARVSPIFESLNAGELSPLLEGRTDFAKYKKGLKKCENWIPLIQGPLTRRPGTPFVARVKDSHSRVRLVPFEFSTTQAYVVEFGGEYCRFFKDRGQILNEDSTCYEISSPYAAEDVATLYYAQSADVLYIAHPKYAPRKLLRRGHAKWSLEEISFTNSPWTPETGYPAAVTFSGNRLFWGGCPKNPHRINGSVVGDYENFSVKDASGVIADDCAVSYTLNADNVNVITWLADDEKGLVVGTVGGEWVVRPSSQGEALTPTNVNARRSARYGSCRGVMPVSAGKSTLFVQRAGRKLRELAYVFEDDGFRAPDLTATAEHITYGGLRELAYQQQPQSIVWAVRADGCLLGFTYEREQEVLAWHRHPLGGSCDGGPPCVESIATIPNPTGDADDLWLVVQRTINGQPCKTIEYLAGFWTDENGLTGQLEDAFFVDCGLTYKGPPVQTITGLDHLEGEEVAVWADGSTHPVVHVRDGSVTLQSPVRTAQVGFGYNSDAWTERLEAGSQMGTAQGKVKRIHKIIVRLWQALGLWVGPSPGRLDLIITRRTSDLLDAPLPLCNDDCEVTYNGTYEKEGRIYLRVSDPAPCTVSAVMAEVGTYDR